MSTPAAAILLLPLAAAAQPCTPRWTDDFFTNGPDAPVSVMAVFDDGRGPALYIGGGFNAVARQPARGIARWNGQTWEAVGQDAPQHPSAMTVFDDGAGPALYVAEYATVRRWNGQVWQTISSGTGGSFTALAVHDDGSGPALFAAARIGTAPGNPPISHVSRWTGAAWDRVGGEFTSEYPQVLCLASAGFGGPRSLFAGGSFTHVGGTPAASIARWNGSAWEPVAGGVRSGPSPGVVRRLLQADEPAGPALYAGGDFYDAGGLPARHVARFNGSAWQPIGSNLPPSLVDLAIHPGPAGPRLYAAGSFDGLTPTQYNQGVAQWNGQAWAPAGGGFDDFWSDVAALAVYDDGRGPRLYAGGDFSRIGDVAAANLGIWDGQAWSGLGPTRALSDSVSSLAVFDSGQGPVVYAGGAFKLAGASEIQGMARWDGQSWSPMPGGFIWAGAMVAFDDGGGRALHVSGWVREPGRPDRPVLGRWNGHEWTSIVDAPPERIQAMVAFDGGDGPALYLTTYDGNQVLTWNGQTFAPVGEAFGVSFPGIRSLAVFDDGAGPSLYAGGRFEMVGTNPARAVAKWNGHHWLALRDNPLRMNDAVLTMKAVRNGPREVLYLGGDIRGQSLSLSGMVAWDGSVWTPMGDQLSALYVHALEAFDDGRGGGPALYAGGELAVLDHATYTLGYNIAKWNGGNWELLERGVGDGGPSWSYVRALAAYHGPWGPSLFAAGKFMTASGRTAGNIARWTPCAPCYANCDGSTTSPILNVSDFICFQTRYAAGDPYANCDGSTIPPVLNVSDFTCFLQKYAAGCP